MDLFPIVDLDIVVEDELGRPHRVSIFGAEGEDARWDGYVEFYDTDGHVMRTPCETTQPSLDALTSWAARLSRGYLEGALTRAEDQDEIVLFPGREGARLTP